MHELKRILSSANLPTLPSVAVQLLELMKNPESGVNDFVQVIKKDPAICAKILKSTNSSYFGFKSSINSIDQAVSLLGTTVVTSLSLSFSLSENSMSTESTAEHFNDYWKQSVVQAVTCEFIAHEINPNLENELFLAGLLSDLGRLAMLKTIPNEYIPVIKRARENKEELFRVETSILNLNHIEAGVALMMDWGLAEELVMSVQHSHNSIEILKSLPNSDKNIFPQATAFATAVGEFICSSAKGLALQRMKDIAQEFFGWSEAQLIERLTIIRDRVDDAADIFKVETNELGSACDLMAEACQQLATVATREHVAYTQAAVREQIFESEKKSLENNYRKLEQQTIRDSLTKVYNRKFFDESLERELAGAARTAEAMGVLFLDIDKFKNLNDTYGHQFGDEVLEQVAQALNEAARKTDVLARYGGEEFVVLLHRPTLKGMQRISERLRKAVESCHVEFKNERVPVTVSVGGAISIPGRTYDQFAKQLLAEADAAMYDSKKGGRNRCHIRSLLDAVQERMSDLSMQKRFSRWCVRQNYADIKDVSRILLECHPPRERIGLLALRSGYITEEELEQISQVRQRTNSRFGNIAIDMELLDEAHIAYLLAIQKEDPALFAETMVKHGYFNQEQSEQLLEQYFTEEDPGPKNRTNSPLVSTSQI